MLSTLRRILIMLVVFLGAVYLLYQGFLFWRAMDKLPPSTTIAGVPVGGMTLDAARDAINSRYLQPVVIFKADERVAELMPPEAGFVIDTEAMIQEARDEWQSREISRQYLEFVIGMSPKPIDITLRARHDETILRQELEMIANYVDNPALGPQLLADTNEIMPGRPGIITDRQASLHHLRSTLYDPDNRMAELVLIEEPAPQWDIRVLQESIEKQLAAFDGFASVYIMDLQTGEEVRINSDVAVSGLSILKIPIFITAYRRIDGPLTDYQRDLFVNTATASSNHSANLLLHIIAGADNTYQGAQVLTEEMHKLGLVNTFMAIPYDAAVVPSRPSTYNTPANQRTDITTRPDSTMQTTAEDIGYLLAMLYYCAEGEGGLLAVYPGEITRDECQAIVDLMVENVEGNLIRFGVPEGVPVSHKHGWSFREHGDAGIVYSPGGDFVIYTLLAQPDTDWMSSDYTFPILRELARAAYNYFNPDNPFEGIPFEVLEAIGLEQEAAAAAAAAEEGGELGETDGAGGN
jgi:beta-lactamase class A